MVPEHPDGLPPDEQVEHAAGIRAAVAHIADDENRHVAEALEEGRQEVGAAVDVADDRHRPLVLREAQVRAAPRSGQAGVAEVHV